jgi:ribosomal protein S18 acetylase RimI-like enzyme
VNDGEVLRRITGYYTSGAAGDTDVVRVGPFAVVLHRSSDLWYLSYATPVAPLGAGLHSDVADVIRTFHARSRTPGFEWIDELHPGLDDALAAAGLPPADREPLLVVDPADLLVRDVAGATVRLVNADEDLAAVLHVSHTAMPELGPVTEAELRRVATEIGSGQRIQAAAEVGGDPVSVGDCSPAGGVAEIAGIGTLPEFRRQGLAGVVTATLAREAFRRGNDVVYLTAATPEAARVYERVGFRRIATGRSTHAS